jgi:hypothetical protein
VQGVPVRIVIGIASDHSHSVSKLALQQLCERICLMSPATIIDHAIIGPFPVVRAALELE